MGYQLQFQVSSHSLWRRIHYFGAYEGAGLGGAMRGEIVGQVPHFPLRSVFSLHIKQIRLNPLKTCLKEGLGSYL